MFAARDAYSSCDVDVPLRVKVLGVEGSRQRAKLQVLLGDPFLTTNTLASAAPSALTIDVSSSDRSELFVLGQVFADNKALTGLVRTSMRSQDHTGRWDEWLTFPVRICDLPLSAQVCLTVWDLYGPQKHIVVGGTALRLFAETSDPQFPVFLKDGKHKLYLWPNIEADGSLHSTTPSEVAGMDDVTQQQKLIKKYEDGDLPRVDWLDKLVFDSNSGIFKAGGKADQLVLHVQLLKFDQAIIWEERLYEALVRQNAANPTFMRDPEALRDSPVEAKHLRLMRGQRSSLVDRELKPNTAHRNELARILAYPPTTHLTADEKNLIWKFRFYLTRDKKALTKFLKSVYWEEKDEEKHALDLLERWVPVDIEDALELLLPTFKNRAVRAYAVSRLMHVDDEELQLFLLQLVQALKYEDLLERSTLEDSALAAFLIKRGAESAVLGNYLYWYLKVETEDSAWKNMYSKVVNRFLERLVETSGNSRSDLIKQQIILIKRLEGIHQELGNLPRPKRIEKLRAVLADAKNGLRTISSTPFPLDPFVHITGVVPERAYIFKSAKLPFLLTFTTEEHKDYSIVFKYGDDVRQDQLVVQIIQLMDRLLRKEKLDLQLTPYKVLATGQGTGMIQFVQADPISKILDENNNDLQVFLRKHNPDSNGPYGIAPSVMDTYVKSCAGYCVITFLLGVGDRHLENLLLTPQDFGYILGKDPKLFPPPMKLSYEMVQCMGGVNSPEAERFRSYCYLAFNALRKSANLILNLISLMAHSSVSDIRDDPEKAVVKVQDNFQLNKSDEESITYFRDLINTSLNAMMPQMFENLHKLAQYFRR